jgi:hypothetical protein
MSLIPKIKHKSNKQANIEALWINIEALWIT